MKIRSTVRVLVVVGILAGGRSAPGAASYQEAVEEAERLWNGGRQQDAVRLYGEVWEQNPDDVERQILYADRSADVRNYRWAFNFLRVAESRSREQPERLRRIYAGYARTYRLAGYPDSARKYERKAAELDEGPGQRAVPVAREWEKHYFGYYTRKPPPTPPGSRATLTRRGLLQKRMVVQHTTKADLDPTALSFADELYESVLRELRRTDHLLLVDGNELDDRERKSLAAVESIAATPTAQTTPPRLWAQFLLKYDLTSFERMPVRGNSGSRMVRAAVSVRVYEVETRSRLVSETFAAQRTYRGAEEESRAESSAAGSISRELTHEIADRIASTVEKAPWKAGIGAVAGVEVSLTAGARSGLRPGQRFEVVRPGESLTDPDTGEVLTIETDIIGVIEVVRVGIDQSAARVVEETESVRPSDQAVAW